MVSSNTLDVFRVETPRGGRGPYTGAYEDIYKCPMVAAHVTAKHPSPAEDGIADILKTEYCGFVTREMLDEWFRGYKKYLHDKGFVIAVYDVPKTRIRFGTRQVVFRRGDLVPYKQMPMLRGKKFL